MKKILVVIYFIFAQRVLFAQSITIDYTSPGLGSSCNVFTQASTTNDHSVTYQNLKHQTTFGFPSYSSSETAVVLQSQPISYTQQGATEYSIAYSFKKGYTYKIRIYGKATLGTTATLYPSVAIYWSISNGGTNDLTTCTGPSPVSSTFDTYYGEGIMSSVYAWSGYLLNGAADQNYSYLLVAAVPARATYTSDNSVSTTYIQKIEITETPPPASFTLPTTTNVPCGSTSPVTFTVTNVNNTPNVTNYTWNLGATPNG